MYSVFDLFMVNPTRMADFSTAVSIFCAVLMLRDNNAMSSAKSKSLGCENCGTESHRFHILRLTPVSTHDASSNQQPTQTGKVPRCRLAECPCSHGTDQCVHLTSAVVSVYNAMMPRIIANDTPWATSKGGWLRDTVVERRSLAGELPLSCARHVVDG